MQPNPEPEPEEFWGYDLGADWRVDSGLFFSATLFQNDVENLIVSRTQRGGAALGAFRGERGRGPRAGLGTQRSCHLPGKRDSGFRLYAPGHGKPENRETGRELAERTNHKVDMSLGWRQPSSGFSAFLEGQYLGRRYADEENADRLGG